VTWTSSLKRSEMAGVLKTSRQVARSPVLIAQFVTALVAVGQLKLFSSYVSTDALGIYTVIAAVWAVGNAVIGTAIGTRVLRDAATSRSTTRPVMTLSDLGQILLGAVAAGTMSTLLGFSPAVSTWAAIGLSVLTIAEMQCSFSLGRGRNKEFAARVIARSVVPVLTFRVLAQLHEVGAEDVLLALTLGALAAALGPASIRQSAFGTHGAMHSIGGANLALWILASADKIILAPLLPLATVGLYGVTYGVLDRGFRALTNAFVAQWLPTAFRERGTVHNTKFFYLLVACCSLGAVVVGPTLIELLSSGKYHPSFFLVTSLVVGMSAYAIASPLYVRTIGLGAGRQVAGVASLCAALNIGINALFVPVGGLNVAAVATAVAYLLWLAGVRLVNRRLMRELEVAGR
jgi:O-antigen/teichoic acid export membrane protein